MILFGVAGAPTLKAQVTRPLVKELYLLLEPLWQRHRWVSNPTPSALTLEN
jgi:hypothetical protein